MLRAIVIVLAFLLIAGVAISGRAFGRIENHRSDRARFQLNKIAMAVDTYCQDTGQLPTSIQQLLTADVPGWDGPYVHAREIKDPWGESVIYRISVADPDRYLIAIIPPQSKAQHQGELILYREATHLDSAPPSVSPSAADPSQSAEPPCVKAPFVERAGETPTDP